MAGKQNEESKNHGKSKESDLPIRSFMTDPTIKWRHGQPPDYTIINKAYMEGKTMSHCEGSLEKLVENLVKTWEMEATHKIRAKDWETIDQEKYYVCANNGRKYGIEEGIERGTYNMLMDTCTFYDAANLTFNESHDLFRKCFNGGFPWELLEVISGPPVVSFKWRHWADWTGPFKDTMPTGERLEMFGICDVKVNDHLKIESVNVYFDPNPFMSKLSNKCPV